MSFASGRTRPQGAAGSEAYLGRQAAAITWSRSNLLNASGRSSGKKRRAPFCLTGGFALWFGGGLRPGSRLREPLGPFGGKVHVIGAPYDEGRRLQFLEFGLDGDGVLVVKRHHETRQVARALFGLKERLQIGLDVLVGNLFRMFVAWP